jgi:thioredoxin reductase
MTSADVVVVGGGPAGLSAALMLGRCRRSVVVCDDGRPRNRVSHALHGYLSRDGTPPTELLRIGRDEAEAYGVAHRHVRVARIQPVERRFAVHLEDGETLRARKVLIATGVEDHLPGHPGFEECYGRSVFHCPYCDGWEWRDRRLAVYGRGMAGASLALSLQTWSRDVVMLGNGSSRVPAAAAPRLAACGIDVRRERVRALEHRDGLLQAVLFEDGSRLARDVVFFTTGQHQQATLAGELGCELTRKGTVHTDRFGQTCVEGVFVVGDASRDVQFVVVAAAEGAKAAVAINQQFQAEDGLVVPGLVRATSWPPNHPS